MDYNPFKSYTAEVKELAYKALPVKERQKILAKCRETREQLGWLYGEIADEIAPQLDRKAEVKTEISKIIKGRIPFRRDYRCTLKILIYTK